MTDTAHSTQCKTCKRPFITADGRRVNCSSCIEKHGKELHLQARSEWAKNHRAYMREHARNWESRNPDKVRAQVRRKYEKHAEAIKAKQRAYTKTERGRLVRAINNYRRRGRIKEGDATYEYMEKLRAETLTCSVCHHTMNDVIGSPQRKSIDHIVPLCIGGEHSNANLRCICNRCNTLRPKDGSDLKRTNYALAS